MNAQQLTRIIRSRLTMVHFDMRNKIDKGDGPVLPGMFYWSVEDRVSDQVWERFSMPEDHRP